MVMNVGTTSARGSRQGELLLHPYLGVVPVRVTVHTCVRRLVSLRPGVRGHQEKKKNMKGQNTSTIV